VSAAAVLIGTALLVAHDRAVDLAALTNMNLQGAGIIIWLETSPANLHGLSHREWEDTTPALAVLMETTNPAQGRLRGRTDSQLVTGGKDRFYVLASEHHRLSVPFPETGWPLDIRVARHLAGIRQLLTDYSAMNPEGRIDLGGIPDYHDVVKKGIGSLLH
jgi:hypothetical protein